jgi:signal recognition particle subunit SRP54
MGSLKSILGMIPGVGAQLKNADVDDKQLIVVESIIQSMTKKERANPKILNGSRRKRIARGSGNTIQDVNRLIKQFEQMQQMMKMMNKNSGKFNLPNMKNFRIN